MKFLITLLLSLIVTCSISAQATRSTNMAVSAANITTMNLDLSSDKIEIKETKGSRIIIEAHITLASVNNTTLLEFLVNSGRYDMESKVDASTSTLTITRKKTNNVLLVKGEECKELVRYVILVPASVKLVNTEMSTASR